MAAGAFRYVPMTDGAVPDSLIPYDEIVQEALRAVVGRVLGEVERGGGLPGEHHFYITFKTQAPGVDIPQHLTQRLHVNLAGVRIILEMLAELQKHGVDFTPRLYEMADDEAPPPDEEP